MRVKVQKWGNSLALRIPKPFAKEAKVSEGALVDLSLQDGKLVATPLVKQQFSLKELLRQVSRNNLHGEIDSGGATGRESW